MYFLGIGPQNADKCAHVVVFNMFLKNIKRHYDVTEIRSVPFLLSDPEIKSEIQRLYADNAFIINKRIFSQDRRPTRTIRANPKLVIHGDCGGENLVKALRALRIPAECVWPVDSAGWEKVEYGKALGDDYRVGVYDLMENLIQLHAQKRILFKTNKQGDMSGLASQLENFKTAYDPNPKSSNPVFKEIQMDSPLILLSLPLWFREKIPYSRSYTA